MLITVGWTITALALGLQVFTLVRLAKLRRQLRGDQNWEYNRGIKKWRVIGSLGFAAGIMNCLCFMIDQSIPGLAVSGGLSLLLVVPLSILSGGEGEGAN